MNRLLLALSIWTLAARIPVARPPHILLLPFINHAGAHGKNLRAVAEKTVAQGFSKSGLYQDIPIEPNYFIDSKRALKPPQDTRETFKRAREAAADVVV